ncbi:hypothetical protein CONLIGDRAFT_20657 [Coniochaeta ligniaria NRRL 30616]|uniref:Uncharacterized protein n=1 Tax=Coniochaeta ligniaria NRRL 30616 TaxID=1408157 RepID=A0A1J7J3T3_9PEZI|nr:hypothetical protein CONLIGDRAFT_20657 [Coniochaeta ligniaria NRRL 30616]
MAAILHRCLDLSTFRFTSSANQTKCLSGAAASDLSLTEVEDKDDKRPIRANRQDKADTYRVTRRASPGLSPLSYHSDKISHESRRPQGSTSYTVDSASGQPRSKQHTIPGPGPPSHPPIHQGKGCRRRSPSPDLGSWTHPWHPPPSHPPSQLPASTRPQASRKATAPAGACGPPTATPDMGGKHCRYRPHNAHSFSAIFSGPFPS